jgi:ATP-dependent Clp protease ATP-binding subunit ClpC
MKEKDLPQDPINDPIKNSIDDDDYEDKSKKSTDNKTTKTPVLDQFGKDITKLAIDGKLDPVVGREKEVERMSQILTRRKKNNPMLVGDPGCVDGDTLITIRKVSDETGHENINI